MRGSLSVIIPVWNCEEWLAASLESALALGEVLKEVIVVDDGSTDGSASIAWEYSLADPRIMIISQKNSGLSASRNRGLEAASGDYILFLDSDDEIVPEVIVQAVAIAEMNGSDLVQPRLCYRRDGLTTGYSDANRLLTSAVGRIYSAAFLRRENLSFEEGLLNEDTLFSREIEERRAGIIYLPWVGYIVNEREGSTSRANFARMFESMDTVFNLLETRYETDRTHDRCKSLLYNLLQTAQRNDYPQFRRDYDFCMKSTRFVPSRKSTDRRSLPLPHRVALRLSYCPQAFFAGIKMANFLGIKMH